MPQKISPYLDVKYGWDLGESGWNIGMDENLTKFSFLLDGNIDGIVNTLPTLAAGAAYFLTTDNRIYYAVGGTWQSTITPKWYVFKLKSNNEFYTFNGTSVVKVDSLSSLTKHVADIELALENKASLASPTFSGVPTVPNAVLTSNNQTISNTKFVNDKLSQFSAILSNTSDATDPSKGSDTIGYRYRSVSERLDDSINVRDFGAVADCTGFGLGTDNLGAFNRAVAYANSLGKSIYVPAGKYRVSGEIRIDNSGSNTLFEQLRTSIWGDGPRQSQIYFDNGNYPGINLIGAVGNSGSPSWQKIQDIALLKNDRQGTGLILNSHFHSQVINVFCLGWSLAHYGVDVHETNYINFVVQFCDYGAKWEKGTFTQPNILSFYNCTIGNCANWAIDVVNPATFTYIGGSIESNGQTGVDLNKWGARLIVNSTAIEGSSAATFIGTYFEANKGLVAGAVGAGDIWYVNSAAPSGLVVIGCSFQRHSPNFTANCIRVEVSGGFKQALTFLGNGFRGFFDYTASAQRPYIFISDVTQPLSVVEMGNMYFSDVEKPDFSFYGNVTQRNAAAVWVRFNGADGSINKSFNVTSVTRNAVGDYTVNYKVPLPTVGSSYGHTLIGANGILQVFQEALNSVRVRTVNLSGVATDFQVSLVVFN